MFLVVVTVTVTYAVAVAVDVELMVEVDVLVEVFVIFGVGMLRHWQAFETCEHAYCLRPVGAPAQRVTPRASTSAARASRPLLRRPTTVQMVVVVELSMHEP
jgi:hypothetical protein